MNLIEIGQTFVAFVGTPQGHYLVVLVASAASTGLVLYVLVWRPNFVWRHFKKLRLADKRQEQFIPQATIVEDFAPLINKLVRKSLRSNGQPTLLIVGSDGAYITGSEPKVSRWRKELTRWIHDGVKIEYILLEEKEEAISAVERIMSDLEPEEKERFTPFVLQTRVHAEFAEEVATKGWMTFHPTLFSDPDGIGEAMWLEGYHGTEDHRAENIRYAGPRAIQASEGLKEEYEYYVEQLTRIRNRCRPITLPA